MEAALAQLRTEGVLAGDLGLSHLSPTLYGHFNPYGKHRFNLAALPFPSLLVLNAFRHHKLLRRFSK